MLGHSEELERPPVVEIEEDIPEEITHTQFVMEYITALAGRISPEARFTFREEIPDSIPLGFKIEVETIEIPSMKDAIATLPEGSAKTLLGPKSAPPIMPPDEKIKAFMKQDV
jgi:hypothetical protein